MTFSLYDAVVPSNLQMLAAVDGLIGKAEAFCTEKGQAPSDLIDARLTPDMLPFGYQVKSCAVHSIGGIAGAQSGIFGPDTTPWPTDFASLQAVVRTAIARLEQLERDAIDSLAEGETHFVFGEMRLPFTSANFLLSFSQPNFYFHATMAYAILRAQGVQIGKFDFLGSLRLKM